MRLLSCLIFSFMLWLIPYHSIKAQARADSLRTRVLPSLTVKARVKRLSFKEQQRYWRRIRDVKKVLPYARYIKVSLIETYEYLQTLPEEEQEAHLEQLQDDLKAEMTPKMKKLTVRQGQLLMQLVERETGTRSYDLLKIFVGGFKAWSWQRFAWFIGTDLKKGYDPKHNPSDALTERIILLLDLGKLK